MHSKEFQLLIKEGNLAKSSLMAGLEYIAKSDYDIIGNYYLAFFQLSIGLERLMKIAFIIDYKIKNALRNPSDKELRKLGHNLIHSYEACKHMAIEYDQSLSSWQQPLSMEYKVLVFLSNFAESSRYYNLDKLVGGKSTEDPIVHWNKIQLLIANKYISVKRQNIINNNAITHCDKLQLYGYELGRDGEYRTQVDITFLHSLLKISRGYSVWTIIKLLEPFYELFRSLISAAHTEEDKMNIQETNVPFMYEFFPFFLCDKNTCIKRKRWINIY